MPDFKATPPSAPSSGIMIIGEAPGELEEITGKPFVGRSGQLLTKMLAKAGINRDSCYLTNVFFERPPNNDLDNFCGTKAQMPKGYSTHYLARGKYVKPQYLHNLERLRKEIETFDPSLILLLGNTACWATLGEVGITNLRGTVELWEGRKVLATFHPASVMRQWDQYPIVIADLTKARRHAATRGLVREERIIWTQPTIDDLWTFKARFLDDAAIISYDIETKARQITCLSFAPSSTLSIVCPITTKKLESVWTPEEEIEVWRWIKEVCALPCPKLAQNGLYDLQYLWRMGIPVYGAGEDTMLLHHSLQPELPKGLGFLGSVYADESSWKNLNRSTTTKRDE